ncbi:aspartate aminotransferase family protein [Dongia deserti]|uniref:aspartate aminotransferase family protein n=1 Tax=Dongia deserti TaxID=2268030 RepID=UPI000E652A08|nr:aminotransferase class III-fold pyridoxal phosphate-dependent enzyme [Dongia deserti]
MNVSLDSALEEAENRYVAANPKSAARHSSASSSMPGGNTRTVLHYSPFPLAWAKGDGAHLTDLDGHHYTDFLGEYSAGLYGHSNPLILDAVRVALEGGIVLGGPNQYEAELAATIRDRFPSIQLLRFCNSGTEANVFAIQTARAATGKPAILAFEGGYHGGVLYFRNGGAPLNLPIPTLTATYNDPDGAEAMIRAHAHELAAVIVEPMMGGGGCIPADRDFLVALRRACTECNVILVFDEVMTSRLSTGGYQAMVGVTPDMTTLGKYLGGGMSFGAFGGRTDLMSRFDPERADAWPHAGTFNNNVLSMAAGLAGLKTLLNAPALNMLNRKGDRLRQAINDVAERHDIALKATGAGSFVGIHFSRNDIKRPGDLDPAGADRRTKLQNLMHLDLIAAGQFYARRGFIALMLPITDAEIDTFAGAVEEFVTSRKSLLG